MKKFLIALVLMVFFIPGISGAVSITMDDGTVINMDGLTDTEITNMVKYVEKMNKAKKPGLGATAADVIFESAKDPAKLNEWRKLITGTIKDIANDLGVGVNEFVKTPVGLGVAALIFYKVAGKNMMETVFQVMFAIPFWFAVIIICAFATKYFLGHKTEIMTITAAPRSLTDGKLQKDLEGVVDRAEKVKIERPVRVCRYNWQSNDARSAFGSFMIGIPIVATVACFLIVFI